MVLDRSDFDPFDPSTWGKKERTVEEVTETEKAISLIMERYQASHEQRQLLRYLMLGKAELAFHRRLRRDKAFKSFVEWIKASESRQERAIEELKKHTNGAICPSCHSIFQRGEEEDLGAKPFDWEAFASEE